MKVSDCSDWLLENSGPIIRYLVMHALKSSPPSTRVRLQGQLMQSDTVRHWMACLIADTSFNGVHGSRDTCFENALGKLSLFGVRHGMGDLDRRCEPYIRLLANSSTRQNVMTVLYQTIVASLLAMAGYCTKATVREWLVQRLETIYSFVRDRQYGIYLDKSKFKNIPSAFRNYPIVDPDLYGDGRFALPWIYDMFAFSVLFGYTSDRSVKEKIEKIVAYVLDQQYQQLPDGYGVVLTGKNHYNVMGWNVWLPGFDKLHMGDFERGCLVQRLELMSRFPNTLDSPWLKSSIKQLEQYRTDGSRYAFPRHYIKERRNSYFVTGAHMGLGENRHRRSACEIESTFWMMKITSNMRANKAAR